jgi:hypothetical protein
MLMKWTLSISLMVMIVTLSISSSYGGHKWVEERGDPATSVFTTLSQYQIDSGKSPRVLKLRGEKFESPMISRREFLRGKEYASKVSGGGRKKRIAVSMMASALLPGLGHAYLYNKSRDNSILYRIPIYIAAEGYFWYGYFHNHNKGNDIKDQYRCYADQHWSLSRFLKQHPCCSSIDSCESWQEYNDYCSDQCGGGDCIYFLFTPRSEDEEEYYENIGKYKAFVYGWDDWEKAQTSSSEEWKWNPHRNYYWQLRSDSDHYLLRGDHFLMLLIVNRVVSMLDAGWLAYRMGTEDQQKRSWSLNVRRGLTNPRITLDYRF